MKKIIFPLLLLSAAWLFCGCAATAYNIKVNGYTDPAAPAVPAPGASFLVIENKEAKNPLLEKEIKEKVNRLLERRGYRPATYEQADYFLFFSYGIGQERSTPVAMPEYYPFGLGFGGGAGYRSYFFVSPYVGYYPYTETVYDRWLLLNVVDARYYREHQGQWRTVWVGEARSAGPSSDLRSVVNYLLLGAFREFGKNTGKAVNVEISVDAPEIQGLIK